MWATLFGPFERIELRPWGRVPRDGGGEPLRFGDTTEALVFLRPFLGDPVNRVLLRRFAAWELAHLEVWRLDDGELARLIAVQMADGSLEATRSKIKLGVVPLLDATPVQTPAPAPTTTWIEIKVVWDSDGSGVGQLGFQLQTPDGDQRKVTTDAQGIIRLDDVERGACDLSAGLKGAEVASSAVACRWGPPRLSQGAAGGGNANVKHLVAVEEHRVCTGETLASIAADSGMSWQELARFNWGTEDKKVVNKAIRTKVGSFVVDQKGDYVFDDYDNPGVLFAPQPFVARGLATSAAHVMRIKPLAWPPRHFVYSL